ncbi:MAG: UDP-N-acetylmuramoyl-L-alanyl-D-glutamate--2,6-diaminopimelate ligase [Armatimonadota bacterium]|nr:UDP-N-acetylmuramoyl-L-alanyl-D-glutamate--2,6-diaminopimelate ligase [Armatimonadota bacterium]MCX7777580.1 UDP-N-acetylmuramoyl-L-alanyl-D-glutamate--2,6-diaminopimelate ligase [Armatimonadota bacterium]MDW8025589.1 UDP-N-acetylmuramoyl-L-alanyl-D-glutamate--2,6-diaminopimelate ligase [Armatimonadota bacterium]
MERAEVKPLRELVDALEEAGLLISVSGDVGAVVSDVISDSRAARDGVAFVCIRGMKHDGHDFIGECVARGASAIILEDEAKAASIKGGVALIKVRDARKALAILSSKFFNEPSKLVRLIGVTGTNGKTTTVHMIAACLKSLGRRVAMMGTLGALTDEGEHFELPHTTPEAPLIQRHLLMFANSGIQDVVMEVSSHALSQDRVLGCAFDAAAFINLTQDHLDYHGDMESYFLAKALLFTEYPRHAHAAGKEFVAAVNSDDPYGRRLLSICACKAISYGLNSECDVYPLRVEAERTRTSMVVNIKPLGISSLRIRMPLIGMFNVYNALAALSVLAALGEDVTCAVEALEKFAPPKGRLEPIDEGQPFMVLIDYAHTPDGLTQVLKALKPLKGDGKLIIVFGCGGERDQTKRPKMGHIASTECDIVIVTSDNPRSEDPMVIIDQILSGIEPTEQHKVLVEPDRRKAISKAIEMAQDGDIVLIAGKGHETYQIVGHQRIPFDDGEVVREILRSLGGRFKRC